MTPWMWIVAGPNGAGKSTFTGRFLSDLGHRHLIKLNADERTRELRSKCPNAAQNDLNHQAAIAVDADVEACIQADHSFVVETVCRPRNIGTTCSPPREKASTSA